MKKDLKGSPARDAFKHWHKTISKYFYACDIDLALVDKRNDGRIVAVVDYKTAQDWESDYSISFSEAIAFANLERVGIKTFVVVDRGETIMSKWTVHQLSNINWRPFPPDFNLTCVSSGNGAREFEQWEASIRKC